MNLICGVIRYFKGVQQDICVSRNKLRLLEWVFYF